MTQTSNDKEILLESIKLQLEAIKDFNKNQAALNKIYIDNAISMLKKIEKQVTGGEK